MKIRIALTFDVSDYARRAIYVALTSDLEGDGLATREEVIAYLTREVLALGTFPEACAEWLQGDYPDNDDPYRYQHGGDGRCGVTVHGGATE